VLSLLAAAAIGAPVAAAAVELGVYQCPSKPAYTECAPSSGASLDEYKSQLGRYPDISHSYRSLDEPLLSADEIKDQASRGVKPMVTVELYVGGYGKGVSLRAIADGTYDAHIESEAAIARKFGGELLVRFGHEMNGTWYPWGAGRGSTAQDYIDAWRHYVSVFRAADATNVKFVWAPNIDGGSYPFSAYFPGDAWVDYVALDGYNWGGSAWLSFADTFATSYATLTQLSSKPVMITETSSSEAGGDKAAWIRDAFFGAIPQRFPRIAAVIWFNRDFTTAGERDWRLSSSSSSLGAYREVVANSLYGGTEPAPSFEDPVPPAPPASSRRSPKKKTAVVQELVIKTSARTADGTSTVAAAPRKILRSKLVYRLSEPAPVRLVVYAPGRARPVKSVTVRRRAGRGSLALSRLVRRRALRRGAYRVVARPVGEGAASGSRRARFRVV
jgi:Glycosyl hydrolase family 26